MEMSQIVHFGFEETRFVLVLEPFWAQWCSQECCMSASNDVLSSALEC